MAEFYGTVTQLHRLARVVGPELSRLAKQHLAWLDYYRTHGRHAALTCRDFGISRQTFSRWKSCFDPHDLTTLEPRSHRPRRVRQPTWSPTLAQAVLRLREAYPRWDVVEVHSQLSATLATHFLDTCQARMPFRIKALQVDGGSEFKAAFEAACQQRGLKLFVLPPRSPKLNGSVERAQRTHREEFYEVSDAEPTVPALNQALQGWERIYNTIRPHQALNYRTPQEYVTQWQQRHRKCHSSTGRVQYLDGE